MSDDVKYQATVHPVQEGTLFGSADLAYWRRVLADYKLLPAQHDGLAEVIVSATSARFMGKRFRELSFSVVVTDVEGADRRDGLFMFHAYNSSAFFAWVERSFFHTPYFTGDLAVSTEEPPSMLLRDGGTAVFHAQCGGRGPATPRKPIRVEEVLWKVPINLPSKDSSMKGRHRMFHARIQGLTSFHAFDPENDVWDVDKAAGRCGFDVLSACSFKPREWQVRHAATHSKGKTIFRNS